MPHSPPVPLCRVPETTMKAVGYKTPRPISDAEALIDFETEKPSPQGRDLLVKVMAVAVNPVDTKVRRNMAPADGSTRILGFDAAGIVEAAGPDAKLFKPGDAVFRSEEHTSELQSLMRISYAVFCLKKKRKWNRTTKERTS